MSALLIFRQYFGNENNVKGYLMESVWTVFSLTYLFQIFSIIPLPEKVHQNAHSGSFLPVWSLGRLNLMFKRQGKACFY